MTTFPASSADAALLERVGENLERLRQRVEASGRDPTSVRVVAVTKTFGHGEVDAALALGLRDFGENYVDELCEKRSWTDDATTWHFLGALQRNKIARVATCASVLSGVAREIELERVARVAPSVALDVEVDFTAGARGHGVAPERVGDLVERARALKLNVRGLMVVAPPGEEPTRHAFSHTRSLCDELGLAECSMGMSDDLEIACELGTTEVRVGRALFGPRDH